MCIKKCNDMHVTSKQSFIVQSYLLQVCSGLFTFKSCNHDVFLFVYFCVRCVLVSFFNRLECAGIFSMCWYLSL